jgi:hypothetical protein
MKARRAQDVQRLFPQQNLLSEDSRKLLTTYAEGGTLDPAARQKLLDEVKGNVNIAMSGGKAGIGRTVDAPNVKEVTLPNGSKVYVQPNVTMKGGKTLGSLSPAEIQVGMDNNTIKAGVSTTAPTSQFENAVGARKLQAESRAERARNIGDAKTNATTASGTAVADTRARLDRMRDKQLEDLAKRRGVTLAPGADRAAMLDALANDIAGSAGQQANIGARSVKAGRVRKATLERVILNNKDMKLPGTVLAEIRAGKPVNAASFGSIPGLNATQRQALADKINGEIEQALRLEGRAATNPGRRKGGGKPVPNEKSLPTQGRSTPGASRGTSTATKATEKATEGFFARNRGLLYGGGAAAAAGLAGYGLYRAMRGGGGGYEPSREPAQPSYDSGGYGEYKSASLRKLAEDRINPARIVGGKADAFSGFDIHGQPCDPPVIENPVALRAQAVRAMINKSMNNYVSNTGDGYDLNRYLGHFNK